MFYNRKNVSNKIIFKITNDITMVSFDNITMYDRSEVYNDKNTYNIDNNMLLVNWV